MKDVMQACMKRCRWCPLIPIIIGITMFLVGYFLDAEAVKTLWLFVSCLPILMGVMGLIMMNFMFKQ